MKTFENDIYKMPYALSNGKFSAILSLKFKAFLFCFLFIQNSSAFLLNGIYYNITSSPSLTVEVISGTNKYTGSVTIPSTIIYNSSTFTVTSIGTSAFADCVGLSSLTIPNSIIQIKQSAFKNCTALSNLTLPGSLTAISDYTFQNCGITGLSIPNSVKSIGLGAFFNSKSLQSIIIPNNVDDIMESAFEGCSSLTSITFPSSIQYLKSSICKNCSSLTMVNLPKTTLQIGVGVFYGCTALKTILLPETLTLIGTSAFSGCTSLQDVILPSSVTAIGPNAFLYFKGKFIVNDNNSTFSSYEGNLYNKHKTVFLQCSVSKSNIFYIPETVTTIGTDAFWGCNLLTKIIIPSSVNSIGIRAFRECTGLTTITIPATVSSINAFAFTSCTGLTTFYSYSPVPIDLTGINEVFYFVNFQNCILYVPIGASELYKNANQWKQFTNIVEMTTGTNQPGINDKVLIFPNPAVNEIKINKAIDDLSISNLAGKVIFKLHVNTNNNISIEHLPKGAYLVTIKLHTGEFVVNKLIKN